MTEIPPAEAHPAQVDPTGRHRANTRLQRLLFGKYADDRQQRVLIQRQLIASGSSLLVIGLFAAGWLFGHLSLHAFLTGGALVLAWFALMGSYIQGLRARLRKARDSTEAANRVLIEQRGQPDMAQRMAHLGSWDWNLVSGELRWSEEAYAI